MNVLYNQPLHNIAYNSNTAIVYSPIKNSDGLILNLLNHLKLSSVFSYTEFHLKHNLHMIHLCDVDI